MRYKDIIGKEIIGIKTGLSAGLVRSAVIDGGSQKIIALIVEDRDWFLETKAVLFAYIRGIGADKVTVDDEHAVIAVKNLENIHAALRENIGLIDLEIISETGRAAGIVDDFIFNPQTGKIEIYLVKDKASTIDWRDVIVLSKSMLVIKESGAVPEIVIPRKRLSPSQDFDLNQLFEKRQISFLTGKRLVRDIRSDSGEVIVPVGSVIDQRVVDLSKESGKFTELLMSVESEE